MINKIDFNNLNHLIDRVNNELKGCKIENITIDEIKSFKDGDFFFLSINTKDECSIISSNGAIYYNCGKLKISVVEGEIYFEEDINEDTPKKLTKVFKILSEDQEIINKHKPLFEILLDFSK